jgi:hypothetical protein
MNGKSPNNTSKWGFNSAFKGLICICTLEVEMLDMLRETKQLTLSFGICQYCDYQTSVVLFSPLRYFIAIQLCLVEILLK